MCEPFSHPLSLFVLSRATSYSAPTFRRRWLGRTSTGRRCGRFAATIPPAGKHAQLLPRRGPAGDPSQGGAPLGFRDAPGLQGRPRLFGRDAVPPRVRLAGVVPDDVRGS